MRQSRGNSGGNFRTGHSEGPRGRRTGTGWGGSSREGRDERASRRPGDRPPFRTESPRPGRTEGSGQGRSEGLRQGRTEGSRQGRSEGLRQGRDDRYLGPSEARQEKPNFRDKASSRDGSERPSFRSEGNRPSSRSESSRPSPRNQGERPSLRGKRVSVRGGKDQDSYGREAAIRERRFDAVAEGADSPDYVAGRRPVLEALKAGRPINKLLVAEGTEGGSLTEIIGKAKASGIVIQTVPRSHLTKISGENHQGVLAYVAAQDYAELEDILKRETGQAPLVVLLDEVTDPYNFGAVLRTAEATGVQGVIIPKRRSVPLTGVVAKAAAGAVEYVPVARVSNLVQAIETLKEQGYWIVGAEGASETSFTEVDYTGKTALVIGAEGKGLSRLVSEKCDFLVKLPMLGKLASLNASVAAGVMLYEIVRQRS